MMANEESNTNIASIDEHENDKVYDIFICFNESDVRFDFTGNLFNALRRKRFKIFMDEEGMMIGQQMSAYYSKALKESKIAIVVFSKNFAADAYCLDELAMIVEGRDQRGQLVIPIFYNVEPSDVRNRRGKYGKDIYSHQRRFRKDSHRLKTWKIALDKVACMRGWTFEEGDSRRCEYELIENIVEEVCQILPRYGVFLSFSEQDTRYSFSSYLYNALDHEGFRVFMKDMINWEEMGVESSHSYSPIIENSRLVIIVLSENYAYSSSSLDELVTILDFKKKKKKKNQLLVWPVFYKVEPTDIRYQKNSYKEAMDKHEIEFGKDSEKVKAWRSALFEVASLNGHHLKHGYDYEYEIVEKIVEAAIKI